MKKENWVMNKSHKVASWAILTAGLFIISALIYNGLTAVKAQGTTIIVNSTTDVADFGGAQQVSDLPGPDGKVSLREAIIAANNTPGPQTIAFNIPTTDPNFNRNGFPGVFLITVGQTPQYTLTGDETTIDGTTQTAYTGDTNPNGPEIHLYASPITNASGLGINSNNNVVRGLGGFNFFRYGIRIDGHNNVVTGCRITQANSSGIYITGSHNIIGGTTPDSTNFIVGNSGNGVWIMGASATGNMVQGNQITSNHTYGVHLDDGSFANTVGGTSPGARNIISDNGHTDGQRNPVGADVAVEGSNNVVQGNYIGVDATGTQALGSTADGVEVSGSSQTIVDNVISGHDYLSPALAQRPAGVLIFGGSGHVIQGNLIGTDASGTTSIPNQIGIKCDIFLFSDVPHDITIGGTAPGDANVIAFSSMDGVAIENNPAATGIRISGNAILNNGELGIDLGDDPTNAQPTEDVTPNDPGDGDTGANNLQNFPVLTSATNNGTNTVVNGTLDTQSGSVTVEFFSNVAADPSGFGEGQTFLGSLTLTVSGVTSFTATLPPVPLGQWITATATNAAGNTSEFSQAVAVQQTPPASITVGSPNGGENWQTNTTQTITWTSSNLSGNVNIELSRDGGATYTTLFANTPNDGSQSWTVTGPATTQALIKISSVAMPSVGDTSNGPFTISSPSPGASLTVMVPDGGEVWRINTRQRIQWTSSGVSGNVKIELSRDGGATYTTLFASTPNDGSQNWRVTGPATTQAIIKISSVTTPSVSDTSNDVFTIRR